MWPGSRAFFFVSFLILGFGCWCGDCIHPLVIIVIEACDIHLETCFFLLYSSSLYKLRARARAIIFLSCALLLFFFCWFVFVSLIQQSHVWSETQQGKTNQILPNSESIKGARERELWECRAKPPVINTSANKWVSSFFLIIVSAT